MQFGVGQSDHERPEAAVDAAIASARVQIGDIPLRAALFYVGVFHDPELIGAAIVERLPGVPTIGATAAAVFSSAGPVAEDAFAVALFGEESPCAVAVSCSDLARSPEDCAAGLWRDGLGALGVPARWGVVLTDGLAVSNSAFIDALAELARDVPLYGAAASRAGGTGEPTRVFDGRGLVTDSAALLLFSIEAPVRHTLSQGWRPIGPASRVTEVIGNDVHRIGASRALVHYRDYLGAHAVPQAVFPLIVDSDDGALVRVPVAHDADAGTVTFGAPIPPGARVTLGESTPSRLLSALEEDIKGLGAANGALIFSCNARRSVLGTRVDEEVATLADALGEDAAYLGMFGFAEFASSRPGGRLTLQNTTWIGVPIACAPCGQCKQASGAAPSAQVLARRLERSIYQRRDLEQSLAQHGTLLRTVSDQIAEARAALAEEKAKVDAILHNILPPDIVTRVARGDPTIADHFDEATVFFADLVGFTPLAARMKPAALVAILDEVFSAFDALAEAHGVEKIKTIGDAYMAAAGIPSPVDDHAMRAARFALDVVDALARISGARGLDLALRAGLNTGSVVAGIIGTQKYTYDLWGDTVNIAARMESHGEPGRVQMTDATRRLLSGADVRAVPRGTILVKGKGEIATWWLERHPQQR